LLTAQAFSAFSPARVRRDLALLPGDPVTIEIIDVSGAYESRVLEAESTLQTTIVAGATSPRTSMRRTATRSSAATSHRDSSSRSSA